MIFAIVSIILNASAQVFMKKTALAGIKPSQLLTNLNLYTAMSLYAVSILLWLVALKDLKLSIAYPLQSLGYVLVTLLSVHFFGEKVSIINIIGISLIFLGALALAVSG